MSLGKLYMAALLQSGDVSRLMSDGDITEMLLSSEVDAYEFIRGFAKEYHKLPTPDTVYAHTEQELEAAPEPAGYYFDLIKQRNIERTIKTSVQQTMALLQPDNKDPDEALKVLTEGVMQLIARKYSAKVVDFRKAYDVIWQAYTAQYAGGTETGLRFGWPTLDEMSGGLVKGDLASFVGRPAAGKTWQMLYSALFGWVSAGPESTEQSRMFVSMEMGTLPIEQRLTALFTHLPMQQIKQASLTTKGIKKMKEGLLAVEGYEAPFYVVDGNLAATVEDLWGLVRMLNPKGLFIDGGYLLKHPRERDRYKRVAENADLIKSDLAAITPTVVSWQFAKTAAKKDKKKGEKADLEDIGYTDAIAQVSSLVIGTNQEESVETLQRRRLDILKGRNGETGSFLTHWDFNTMDFSEIVNVEPEELQFV